MHALQEQIFHIRTQADFTAAAMEVFHYQYQNCNIYRQWVDLLGIRPHTVQEVADIPALPIELFKSKRIVSFAEEPTDYFQSSGTSGMEHSRHYYRSLELYEQSLRKGFRLFWGEPSQYCIVALLPNYLEQGHSSLIHMVRLLIEESHCPQSGFYGMDTPELQQVLDNYKDTGRRLLLFGVSYALLDLMEIRAWDLHDAIVFETGGMKGRRVEMAKPQLHECLCQGLHVDAIASEYGMCELFSQAYSYGNGLFCPPPWMQIRIRDLHAPLLPAGEGRNGGIDVIDLANIDSCSFIATQDLGRLVPNAIQQLQPSTSLAAFPHTQGFEILGRIDGSDIRGCNLMCEM